MSCQPQSPKDNQTQSKTNTHFKTSVLPTTESPEDNQTQSKTNTHFKTSVLSTTESPKDNQTQSKTNTHFKTSVLSTTESPKDNQTQSKTNTHFKTSVLSTTVTQGQPNSVKKQTHTSKPLSCQPQSPKDNQTQSKNKHTLQNLCPVNHSHPRTTKLSQKTNTNFKTSVLSTTVTQGQPNSVKKQTHTSRPLSCQPQSPKDNQTQSKNKHTLQNLCPVNHRVTQGKPNSVKNKHTLQNLSYLYLEDVPLPPL